jgi:hypothetical protein
MLGGSETSIQLSMNWQEDPDAAGNYTGNVLKITGGSDPKLADTTVVVIDGANVNSALLSTLASGGSVTAGTVTVQFTDVDGNTRLGSSDVFTATGVGSGDIIRLTHEDAGEMSSKTF